MSTSEPNDTQQGAENTDVTKHPTERFSQQLPRGNQETKRRRRLQPSSNGSTSSPDTSSKGGMTGPSPVPPQYQTNGGVQQTPPQGIQVPQQGAYPQGPYYGVPFQQGAYPQGFYGPPAQVVQMQPQQTGMVSGQLYYVDPASPASGRPSYQPTEDIQVVTRGGASSPQRVRMIWGPFGILLFGLGLILVGAGSIYFDIFTTSYNISSSITHTNTAAVLACMPQKPLSWLSPAFWLAPNTLLAVLPGVIVELIGTSVTVINSESFIVLFKQLFHDSETTFNVLGNPWFRTVMGVQIVSQVFNVFMTSSYIRTITNQNNYIAGFCACLLVLSSLAFIPIGLHLVRWAGKRCIIWCRDTFFPPIAPKTTLRANRA